MVLSSPKDEKTLGNGTVIVSSERITDVVTNTATTASTSVLSNLVIREPPALTRSPGQSSSIKVESGINFAPIPYHQSKKDARPDYVNIGTIGTPFEALEIVPVCGTLQEHYQTITIQPEYEKFSVEELRVVDYAQGRGPAKVELHQTHVDDCTRGRLIGIEQQLRLFQGPAIEVKVVSETGESQVWTISQALLTHHSHYFEFLDLHDASNEQEIHRTELKDFEPRIFGMFIWFIYYGQCNYNANSVKPYCVLDSAKAWVLGDKLKAIEFKNFHMRNLHDIYMPSVGIKPKASIGPEIVAYCFSKMVKDSKLILFIRSVLVQNWGNDFIVSCDNSNKEEWIDIWEEYGLGNDLLLMMNGIPRAREHHNRYLGLFIEPPVPTNKTDQWTRVPM